MIEHNTETPEVLSRAMGTWEVTVLGVGAMIGAGIFVLTGWYYDRSSYYVTSTGFLFGGYHVYESTGCNR